MFLSFFSCSRFSTDDVPLATTNEPHDDDGMSFRVDVDVVVAGLYGPAAVGFDGECRKHEQQ